MGKYVKIITERIVKMIIRSIERNDESEVYHMWSQYHIDELPYVWARRLCTIKPIRYVFCFAFIYSLAVNVITSLVLAGLSYTLAYIVSLVEMTYYVTRDDMKTIVKNWGKNFLVAVTDD